MNRKYAVPCAGGICCAHFGHCQNFALIEVVAGTVSDPVFVDPPAHQPGTFPRFLAEQGVGVILAGGMGVMAQNLFRENNIEVHLGVAESEPRSLVEQYLKGDLQAEGNRCNHGTPEHEPNCGH